MSNAADKVRRSSDFFKVKLRDGARLVKKGARDGFFHILGGNMLVQVIAALVPLLYPRVMGADYSTFMTAKTYVSYLLIFNGLGLVNGILRYCAITDDPGERNGYFAFALRFGLWANAVVIAIYGGIIAALRACGAYQLPNGATDIFLIYALTTMLTFAFNALQYYMRASRENRLFSYTSVVNSAAFAFIQLGFALIFKLFGMVMQGAVTGIFVAYIVSIGVALCGLRRIPAFRQKPIKLTASEKTSVVKYSVNSMVATSFSLLMPINESALVNNMVSNVDFGSFTAAQMVPNALSYLANAVMIYSFPHFARQYRDGGWVLRNTKRMVLMMSAVMAVTAFLGILLSPTIVLIFGKRFASPESVRMMRLFFIAYAVSGAVRQPVGNVLAAIGEVKFNIINSAVTFVVHLSLCWYLTSNYGIRGAAYGLLIGYVFSAVAASVYLHWYCRRLEKKKNA
jgi:O-antigen/teichoic acid export membrane protein